MTTTIISFATTSLKASFIPLASLIGIFPLPYAQRITPLHSGTALTWAEREWPVIPGYIRTEITDGVVRSSVRRGGREGDLEGRREGFAALLAATTDQRPQVSDGKIGGGLTDIHIQIDQGSEAW